jgi:pimeloyl-ACP methyl ester carboxylesterase
VPAFYDYDTGMTTATAADLHSALAAMATEARTFTFPARHYTARVVRWGTGPDLVLLPGMSDVPRSFAVLMHKLADRFRCTAIHLADGDRDGCRYRAYKHEHHLDDLLAICAKLNLDRPHLLGSSFGSTVALRFAADHPDRVRTVILQGGFPRRQFHRIERGLARMARYWPGMMKDLIVRPYVMERFDRPQFAMADPAIYDFFLECSGAVPIQCAARRALMLDAIDLRPRLKSIRKPVLLIGGDRDGLVPRIYEAELEAGLPDVRRVEYSPCGHYPQYTHPGPMAEAMAEFMGSR